MLPSIDNPYFHVGADFVRLDFYNYGKICMIFWGNEDNALKINKTKFKSVSAWVQTKNEVSESDYLRGLIKNQKWLNDEDFYIESVLEVEVIQPSFKGCDANWFSKWVEENIDIKEVKFKKANETVYVQFKVAKNGSVEDVKIAAEADIVLSLSAISTISQSPQWKPAGNMWVTSGSPYLSSIVRVETTYVLPVIFTKKKLNAKAIDKILKQRSDVSVDGKLLEPAIVYVK